MDLKTEVIRIVKENSYKVKYKETNGYEMSEIELSDVADEIVKLFIPDVGNCALYNDMPLVYNMCLSYRHDFGLLNATEQEQLVFECKEWLRSYENNK